MSTPFRYDWLGSLERIQEAGEDPASFCLYCLPVAGVKLLVALLERGRWRASFRVSDTELSEEEWTFLQDIVDDTEVGLMANCDELVSSIVNQVSQQVNQTNYYQDICCYQEQVDPPLVDPPASEVPPGMNEEAGLRCSRAQMAHENGLEFITQALQYVDEGGGLTAGIITILLAGLVNPITLPIALLATIIGALVALVFNDQIADVLLEWNAIGHDVACCFAWSGTAEQAKNCIHDVIDTGVTNSLAKSLFKAIYNQGQVNAVWDGAEGYGTGGFSPLYCNDCLNGQIVGIGWTVEHFDTDAPGMTSSGIGWQEQAGNDTMNGLSGCSGRVNREDLPPQIEGSKVFVIYDDIDPTDAPGYSAEWFTHECFNPEFTVNTFKMGLDNGTSSTEFNFEATISGFRLLWAHLDGSLSWIPCTISAGSPPSGVSVADGVVTYDWQTYPTGSAAQVILTINFVP